MSEDLGEIREIIIWNKNNIF